MMQTPYPWKDVLGSAGLPHAQADVLKLLHLRSGRRLPLLDLPAADGRPEGLRLASLPREARSAASELRGLLSERVLETCP